MSQELQSRPDPLPLTIDGHTVTPEEQGIFLAFHRMMLQPGLGMNLDEIAESLGISRSRLRAMRLQPWWRKLQEQNFTQFQGDVYAFASEIGPELFKAAAEIIQGKRADDRSVNATHSFFKTLMEIGKNPLIDKRPINIKNEVNTGGGNVTVNQMRGWDRERINEYVRTGIDPKAGEAKVVNP